MKVGGRKIQQFQKAAAVQIGGHRMGLSQRIADQRARHAMRPAPTPAKLTAGDGNHLDPGLAQKGVGMGVAVIADHHTRAEAQQVVRIIPLFALGFIGVAAGRNGSPEFQAQRMGNNITGRLCFGFPPRSPPRLRAQRVGV